jgi:hypothetical protein
MGDVFIYNFKDTFEDGKYKFTITAIDLTIYRNKNKISDSFIVIEDTIPPVISYYIADPYVQLKGNEVSFYCIASDNNRINTVEINVELSKIPSYTETNKMEESSGGKFEFKDIYDKPGKYYYYVNVFDYSGVKTTTPVKTFWITSDIDDTDNDGMPDHWERKYGLNPEDSNDADLDFDEDGISNLEEYNGGTNPSKDIFIENVAFRVRDNIYYLIGSIILFLLLAILPNIDKWRKLI